MRFTLSGFIVSTVALLSLITPVVYAGRPDEPAVITSPKAGAILNTNLPVDVEWYVVKGENLSAVVLS